MMETFLLTFALTPLLKPLNPLQAPLKETFVCYFLFCFQDDNCWICLLRIATTHSTRPFEPYQRHQPEVKFASKYLLYYWDFAKSDGRSELPMPENLCRHILDVLDVDGFQILKAIRINAYSLNDTLENITVDAFLSVLWR